MQLSVIIVNYNVKYFLEQCLYAVQKACRGIDAEIIVVDNHSTDGSRAFLEPAFPAVTFIWNEINTGFAKANNQAYARANGDYILFLNPDTILPEDCIEKCLQFFGLHKDAGAIGIRMIDGSGTFLKESKRAFPSPLTSLYKLSGLTGMFPRSRIFARYHLGHLPENENHEVDVLAGAFMMIPKKVLDEVGIFDERFFMYGEDVDLSYRIQKATCSATGGRYKNFYFSESTIIHFKGESTKRGSLNYVRLFYKAMSLFVKKHYSGSKASVFIFLVQVAIILRGGFSALGNLFKKMGLPILDAGTILSAFWVTKIVWSAYIRREINYSPNVLIIAFPIFTIIFLIAAYYSGLYDKGYKQSQLIKSTLIAALCLLSGYALLPESIRFSRGILIFGIFMAYILMNILRLFLIRWRMLETSNEDEERRQTIVVADGKDFENITAMLQKAGLDKRILGSVGDHDEKSDHTLGSINQLPGLVKKYPIKEIIFCENGLSYKEIIHWVMEMPAGVRNKFHASGSSSIVGSDSKYESGDYVSVNKKLNISDPLNRRNKRLFDTFVAVFFILSFPVNLLLQKKPFHFYKNVFLVLWKQRTWIGYATEGTGLPALLPGILSSTSLPTTLNELPPESLLHTDQWYASSYSVVLDLQKLKRGYRYLYY